MEAQATAEQRSDDLESRFGDRFVCEDVPDRRFPRPACLAQDAMRMIGQELVLDGDPQRNLATFVTTWMEPEAQRSHGDRLLRRS
jgi:glutamate decarboxylase